jgi:tetratricopeptide (TPR) repeat protein
MSDSTITLHFSENPDDETRPSAGPDATGSLLSSPTSGRYVLLTELARGGMGVVFTAHDLALNRNVAVKVLRKDYQPRPDVARRFLEEARITGQLQHPGIPPVHDLGTLLDGRPFLAMKLIEGRTLAQLLKERSNPSHELPRLLHIFGQVAQTVAYTHAQGVIHRDLKPSNVMVGAFGEVQVMDWGLAEVLADRPPPTPARDPATRAAGVVGTLGYMPPEQANGSADAIDARADVFALGGVLCELLTGSAPFAGPRATMRALTLAGDLGPAFARLDDSGADPELVALAKQCLDPNPAARPADAGLVAVAVAAFCAGVELRLRKAEVERAEAAVREAERGKRRRVQLALAAVGVLVVLTGGVAAWRQDRHATERRAEREREEARTWEAVSAGLGEVEAALRVDDLVAADAALARVRPRLGPGAPAALRDRLAGLDRDRDMVAALEFFTDAHRTNPPGGAELLRDTDSQDYDEVFRRYGLDLRAGDPGEMAARIAPSPIRAQLLDGLDAALGHYGFSAVNIPAALPGLLRRVDPNPARNQIRDAVFANAPLCLLARVRELGEADLTPGFAVLLVGQQFDLPPDERLRILTATYDRHPDNFRLNHLLCLLYLGSGREASGESAADSLAAATTHARILVSLRPLSPAGYRLLGTALKRAGQFDAAIAALQKAAGLTAAPDRASGIKYQIGAIIRQQEGPDAAMSYFRRQVRQTPDDAYAHWNLGRAFRDRGDLEAALGRFRRAIELQPAEGVFYPSAAQTLRQLDDLDEAVRVYRLAEERARPLRWSHIAGLGPLLIVQGKYREAVRAQERLMAGFPECARAVNTFVRYDAARAAALAGTAGGIDPGPPADRPAARLKALGWLRADLTASRTEFTADPRRVSAEADARLRKWVADPHLAGVRHPFLLALLPPAEAREWLAFWDEVRKLRDEIALTEASPPPEAKRP